MMKTQAKEAMLSLLLVILMMTRAKIVAKEIWHQAGRISLLLG